MVGSHMQQGRTCTVAEARRPQSDVGRLRPLSSLGGGVLDAPQLVAAAPVLCLCPHYPCAVRRGRAHGR